ncbi:MAG: hypothetical protein HFG09_06585, partial [Oscillibacter sp.]|nr:hypothetical protein [Oscillibacter sp.]
RRHPDGWQGFLTQSGRIIRRQDMRGEILNRLLDGRHPKGTPPPPAAARAQAAAPTGSHL